MCTSKKGSTHKGTLKITCSAQIEKCLLTDRTTVVGQRNISKERQVNPRDKGVVCFTFVDILMPSIN